MALIPEEGKPQPRAAESLDFRASNVDSAVTLLLALLQGTRLMDGFAAALVALDEVLRVDALLLPVTRNAIRAASDI